MNQPRNTPWGHPDHVNQPVPGVPIYEVDTPGHGGLMIDSTWADKHFNPAAFQTFTRPFSTWLCYEEDVDWAIATWEYAPLRAAFAKRPHNILDFDAYVFDTLTAWNVK